MKQHLKEQKRIAREARLDGPIENWTAREFIIAGVHVVAGLSIFAFIIYLFSFITLTT